MFKDEIINRLGRSFGLRRYLEICTPGTGLRFGHIDASHWHIRHRLIYRCPDDFDDGLPAQFTSRSDSSRALIRAVDDLVPPADRYDLIFVDPYHSYEASLGDLSGALCLLRPGGIIVAHDCNPLDVSLSQAEFKAGNWHGVTYHAFIDFALSARAEGYFTVDADYGCGVVFSPGRPLPPGLAPARPSARQIFEWRLACENGAARFDHFERNRQHLLNLVSVEQFVLACDRLAGDRHHLERMATPVPM